MKAEDKVERTRERDRLRAGHTWTKGIAYLPRRRSCHGEGEILASMPTVIHCVPRLAKIAVTVRLEDVDVELDISSRVPVFDSSIVQ